MLVARMARLQILKGASARGARPHWVKAASELSAGEHAHHARRSLPIRRNATNQKAKPSTETKR
jgi:hypothetical protein